MDIERRNKLVRDKRGCVNCLADSHTCRQCSSKYSCKTCGGRHHTLLHRDREPATTRPSSSSAITTAGNFAAVAKLSAETMQMDPSFPFTVTLTLDNAGRSAKARAVLDSGAAISSMSEKLASDLKLKRFSHNLIIDGPFSNHTSKYFVMTSLLSHCRSYQSEPIKFAVVPRIKAVPAPANRDEIIRHPELALSNLADPDLGGEVDLYIGNMDMDQCVHDGTRRFNGYKAVKTTFGVSIAGPLLSEDTATSFHTSATPDDLKENLSRLWDLDQVPEAPNCSPEDTEVIETFNQTYQRIEGRFSVTLPARKTQQTLGDTRRQAMKRLLANERSLSTKDKLDVFQRVLLEYLDMGHAHVIPHHQLTDRPHFYLPVHGVFKDSSSTTKVRAVFDASAKSSTGISLNDNLLAGPNLYPPLQDVIIRFRRHNVGLSADISKMFREILLNPSEKDLHRFLMRDSSNQIVDCRMDRLTFGVTSSPFLATQVLHTLAQLHSTSHPSASAAILHDFYVDDLLSGSTDVTTAKQLQEEICDLLSLGKMTLRKWRTNSIQLRSIIPDDLREKESELVSLNPQNAPKALGVHWDVNKDVLYISTPETPPTTNKTTKRSIASATAGVFDVLGLFSPAIIPARILFQETWKRQLTWDKQVPDDIQLLWETWIADLPTIHEFAIPRRLNPSNSKPLISQLHGFSDASKVAYGAAIYLRTVNEDGSISTTLVVAKARVLPVKPVTIPRAELLGAHLLARMLTHTGKLLGIPDTHLFAWTDSEIVLYWLPKHPSSLDRFVANRIHAIQDLVDPTHWRHVRTHENPADLTSRGVRAPDLTSSTLWWSGPPWLSQPPTHWPAHKLNKPTATVQCLSITASPEIPTAKKLFLQDLWSRFSSFHLLTKVVAWILRLKLKKNLIKHTQLTSEEILSAKRKLLSLAQMVSYPEVISAISLNKRLPKGHRLQHHKLTMENELIYIESRVRDPTQPSSPRKLIVLHPKSKLTRLLLRTLHGTYSHAGISALESILCHTYYIPGLRNLLKLISRTCAPCQRAYAKPLSHQMGMLPPSRTTPAPTFDRVGIDFAGPFILKRGHTRKPTLVKAYAVVFVCMATKAVHLDLCASLSTPDFIATLTRFVSRRGCPSHVFTDNGTNFLGAREEIRELQTLLESSKTRQAVTSFSSSNGIQWHNIPPRAPHFGGLWEAAVNSMKKLIRKNITPHALQYDEFYTLITQVEATLNSRPLTPILTDDVTEGKVLTAGHFLIGRPIRALPTHKPSEAKITSLRRWNLVQRLSADIWQQWLSSYLASCAQRSKWIHQGRKLVKGDLVFIKDETLKTLDWPIGIILEVHPGDDNVTRVVTLRCRGKEYRRSVERLILLEQPKTETT